MSISPAKYYCPDWRRRERQNEYHGVGVSFLRTTAKSKMKICASDIMPMNVRPHIPNTANIPFIFVVFLSIECVSSGVVGEIGVAAFVEGECVIIPGGFGGEDSPWRAVVGWVLYTDC